MILPFSDSNLDGWVVASSYLHIILTSTDSFWSMSTLLLGPRVTDVWETLKLGCARLEFWDWVDEVGYSLMKGIYYCWVSSDNWLDVGVPLIPLLWIGSVIEYY